MKYLKYLLLCFFLIVSYDCSNDKSDVEFENGISTTSNKKATGSSAKDFLSSDKYQSLVIEVSYVENYRPNGQTLLNLKQFLDNRIYKPNGITIIEKQIPAPTNSPYSIEEIVAIENANRTKYNSTGILTVHLLYINGRFETDTDSSKTLGTAYYNTSAVLFEETIQDLSDQITEPSRVNLETTVLIHEFCHLLGLVNLGSPMQNNHLDIEHDKHCNNEACLMFWKTDNNTALEMLSNGSIPQLDANCILDLQANGGK